MSEIKLPDLIDILFENPQLERTRIICILNCFHGKTKGISLKELAYYYAIIVSELNIHSENELRYNIANLYISLQWKIKRIIMELNTSEYIKVFNINEDIFDNIKIKLNKKGVDFVNSLENVYFKEFQEQLIEIKKLYTYSSKLEKELLNRRSYG